MAQETEIDRLVVRLGLDGKPYEKGLKKAAADTDKFTRDINGKLRDARGRFVNDTKAMAAATARLGFGMKRTQRVTADYAVQLATLGNTAIATGRKLTLGLTAPIAIIGGLAVRSFAGFDQAMTESTSIMKVTTEQADRMRTTALNLSREAVQGPAELAKSYFFLASAGKNAEQSMALLPRVAKFATAGAFDMATATDLLTDAQSALGMSSSNVARDTANLTLIGDSLVKANTLANASVQQFAESLTSDAATASRSFGQDLSTTMAILALYADKGKKAAESGNLFGRATRLLTKAARDNAEEFSKRNIRVVDKATGRYRTFIEILDDMNVAFAELTKPQIGKALSDLGFEALAQKSILPLLGATEQLEFYRSELLRVSETTDRVANKQLESFSNRLKIVKNNATVMAISIGEVLAPMLASLGDKLISLTAWWDDLAAGQKTAIVSISLMVAALGPLLLAFGGVVKVLGLMSAAVAISTRSYRIMRISLLRTGAAAKFLSKQLLGVKVAAAAITFVAAVKLGEHLAGGAKAAKELNLQMDIMANRSAIDVGRLKFDTEDMVTHLEKWGGTLEGLREESSRLRFATARDMRAQHSHVERLTKVVADSAPTWKTLWQSGKAEWLVNKGRLTQAQALVEATSARLLALESAAQAAEARIGGVAAGDTTAQADAAAKRQKAMNERFANVDDFIANLQLENKLMLETANTAELIRQRLAGASGDQIETIEFEQELRAELQKILDLREANAQKEEDAIAAAKQHTEAMKASAKAIIESQRSPLQIFNAEVAKLQGLLDAGLLTQAQFGMASEAAEESMRELKDQIAKDTLTIPVQFTLISASIAGSAEALARLEHQIRTSVKPAGGAGAGVSSGREPGMPAIGNIFDPLGPTPDALSADLLRSVDNAIVNANFGPEFGIRGVTSPMPTAPVPANFSPELANTPFGETDVGATVRELLGVSERTADATEQLVTDNDEAIPLGLGGV